MPLPSSRLAAHLVVVVPRPADLVLVNGQTGDVGTGDGGNGAQGAADTAAAVQRLHAGLEAQHCGNAGLMRSLRGLPVLAGKPGGEVEALGEGEGEGERHACM